MKNKFFTIAVIIFLFAIVVVGCVDSESGSSRTQFNTDLISTNKNDEFNISIPNKKIQSVSISLPDMPFNDTEVVKIDKDLMTVLANKYFSLAGEEAASAAAFFLGYLPLVAADALGGSDIDANMVARQLGNLAVSGFFGGIWLRDALRDRKTSRALGVAGLRGLPIDDLDAEEITQVSPVFKVLSALAGSATATAMDSTDRRVLRAGQASITPFLILYGYNWGYFYYILDNPPEGATVPVEYDSVCSRFLDCKLPDVSLNTLMRYEESLNHLYPDENAQNENRKWQRMKSSMDFWGLGAVNAGDFVWELIMNDQMSPEVYGLLLDLSARFMIVAELCVLPAMKGAVEKDPAASRVAILEQAGMVIWAGTYFMGLLSPVSNVPTGTFPSLIQKE